MPKIAFHFLSCLCIALLCSKLAAEPLLGSKAPDFQGMDLTGVSHRLSDYTGKIVVLEWSSPECPYSRRYYENGTLDSLYEFAEENGIVWINIVPRPQKLSAEQVTKGLGLSKKIVILDAEFDISTTYGATTTPEIFIVDRQGVLSYTGAIDSTAMHKKTSGKAVPYTRNALVDLLEGRRVKRMITRAFGCHVKNNAPLADDLPQIIPTGSR